MTHPESRLTHTFGISRNDLRALRQKILTPKEDWFYEKRAVVYTLGGFEKIRAHLAVGEIKSAQQAASALPEPVTLLVWNCRLVNKKIVLAYLPDTDPRDAKNLLRVRVKSSENFTRFVNGQPMPLKARHVQADLYELAGQCPRRKGWIPPNDAI